MFYRNHDGTIWADADKVTQFKIKFMTSQSPDGKGVEIVGGRWRIAADQLTVSRAFTTKEEAKTVLKEFVKGHLNVPGGGDLEFFAKH